jgi:2-(1,2-epoxy-1,2-dihydrophenyl)acetyl-CoA isomerase
MSDNSSAPASEPTVLVSSRDGVRTITLNRPDALNTFTRQLHTELAEALRAAERDADARVIVLTGAGRAFCAGQDLKETGGGRSTGDQPRLSGLLRSHYNGLIKRLRSIEKPVIAAINGVAAGAGLSVALACDLRIASEAASFVPAFSAIGLVPDSGGLYFLPRVVGWPKATELFLTSDRVTAEEALRLGLVTRVVSADGFEEAIHEYAVRFAQGPTLAFGLIKRGLNRSLTSDLDAMLELEAQYQEIAGRSEDFREGVAAFINKRKPEFKGR